ncbi:outer membrane protein assembly factor BamB family protein [Salinigranum salinum]|uniref:outer membrane protein assembly factor BamB family protein n=1 Tax=Salinigranum salinum TaxID=1364937 RepID=UPI001260D940|nr:PQQ-binding-like beta-propeller repeat protein [Salinigranum salinum]
MHAASSASAAAISRRDVLRAATAVGITAGVAGCARSREAFPERQWPMAGGGPRNASSLGGPVPNAVEQAWQASLGGRPTTPPIVASGTVYVGSERRFHAFGADDGSRTWEAQLPNQTGDGVARQVVAGSPAYGGDGVVVCTGYESGREGRGGIVHGYDAETGDRLWHHVPDGRYAYSVRIANGTAYLRTSTVCLALSTESGDVEWRQGGFEPLAYETFNIREPYGIGVAPAVADGTVYVPDRNRLRALSADTGEERWRVELPYCLSGPAVVDDRVYARGYSSESRTVALTRDGEEVWRAPGGGLAPPTATADAVFVANRDLVALDAATGEERWRWDLRMDLVRAAPIASPETVIALGNRSAALHQRRPLLGLGGRVRWTLPDDVTAAVSPAVGAGALYAVNPLTGQLVAYRGA